MNLDLLADLESQYGKRELSVCDEIDLICDEFEKEWRFGRIPSIDEYVARGDIANRQRLYSELAAIDLGYRQQQGGEKFEDLLKGQPQETSQAAAAIDPVVKSTAVPGMTIAHYERKEKVGAGGFGTVWRAYDRELGRDVALKLAHHPLDGGVDPKKFYREARIAAKIEHPGIVRVYEVGQVEGRGYIVSEFVKGMNLKDWSTSRPHSELEIAEMCLKIAKSLVAAHRQGIIHRDLKPENILVDEAQEPRITDFGLAKCQEFQTTNTVEGQLLGTPAYMSPEQATGKSHLVDERSDVYSLGIILYQLLVGKVPFEGSLTAVLHQVTHEEPLPPRSVNPAISREIEAICLKAIVKDPNGRYASSQALADDLQRFLSGEPTVARPQTYLHRAWRRFSQKAPLLKGVAFGAVAAPLAAIIAALSFSPSMPDDLFSRPIPRPGDIGQKMVVAERVVHIATEPAGARLALAPIDPETGAPRESKVIRPEGTTPLEVSVPAGLYLVVADIPGFGFHEVYRTIPGVSEMAIVNGVGKVATERSDGGVDMPLIKIRAESDVISNLAYFPEGEIVVGDRRNKDGLFLHDCHVTSFYLQTREVTVAEFHSTLGKLPADAEFNDLALTDRHPIVMVSFHDAVNYAEEIGMRVPFTHEFEWALTNGGTTRFPWGDDSTLIQEWKFDIVGEPAFDQTKTVPPVYGLFSNVAEWVDTRERPDWPGGMTMPESIKLQAQNSHIVRGGSRKVLKRTMNHSDLLNLSPGFASNVVESNTLPGVGFRCARSAKPRFLNE